MTTGGGGGGGGCKPVAQYRFPHNHGAIGCNGKYMVKCSSLSDISGSAPQYFFLILVIKKET